MIPAEYTATEFLRSIAGKHTPSNIRQFTYLTYNGEAKRGVHHGYQTDIQPQAGKVVDMNDDWVVMKIEKTRASFFLCAKELLTDIPNIGDTVIITPYARKRFDGRRLDEPDRIVSDGVVIQTFTIGENRSRLPIDQSALKCPELKEMINQVEQLRSPDGQRTIAQMLIDSGAGHEVKFNDPKPKDIISSPPTLTFDVKSQKLHGDITISYDRGMDMYDVTTRDATGNVVEKIETVDFSSLAQVVHDLVDDGQWKIAKLDVVKPAPRKRAAP